MVGIKNFKLKFDKKLQCNRRYETGKAHQKVPRHVVYLSQRAMNDRTVVSRSI